MPAPEANALVVLLRWMHALAAVAFLGWSLALFAGSASGASADPATGRRYKVLTDLTLVVFLASGAVLTFDRFARGTDSLYVIILAVKVLGAVATYQAALLWRRAGLVAGARQGAGVLVSGACVILLAAILREVVERGLRSQIP